MAGAVLLAGFAIEGLTILEMHRLLWLHFAVGFLLCGPVLLKIGSTLYRFVMYYTGSAPYVRRGPPMPALRVLGPLVVGTSVAVLGTGVILAVAGPGNGPWLFLHKVSFILWFGVMTIHVLAYAPRLPQLLLRRRMRDGSLAPAPRQVAPSAMRPWRSRSRPESWSRRPRCTYPGGGAADWTDPLRVSSNSSSVRPK